jgi:membrane protease YdiL (CAAX protease family)
MTTDIADAVPTPRIRRFWFEYPVGDLPFYNGRPTSLSGARWLLVLGAVALGFAALIMPVPALQRGPAAFVPATLFFAIPLAMLALVAPGDWTRIFRGIGPRDVLWMFAFALLNIMVTFGLGFLVMALFGANPNPVIANLSAMSDVDRLIFFGKTIPQLFGEEVLTILPFLAVLTFLHGRAGFSRRWAIVGGWILSAALFGAIHLPTYGWNLIQCLVIIGGARLVLTLPYVMTKNIWVSTGAHIINDWTLLGGAMLLMALAAR